eukprot:6274987-Pyramimonas_sp.AAC.1
MSVARPVGTPAVVLFLSFLCACPSRRTRLCGVSCGQVLCAGAIPQGGGYMLTGCLARSSLSHPGVHPYSFAEAYPALAT